MQHVTALSAGGVFSITVNSGASGEFNIPTSGTGYDYDVNTSDGQNINGNTGSLNVIFPDTDTIYTINISGSFPRIFIGDVSPNDTKLLTIEEFGIYGIGSTVQSQSFNGCTNLIINAIDLGNFGDATLFIQTWKDCSSLTSFPFLEVSSGINFSGAWFRCNSLTSFPLLNLSNGTTFTQTWFKCSSLSSFPLLDVSSGTNFSFTWQECESLTSFPLLDVSSGTNFSVSWFKCYALTSFPLLNVSNGTNFSSAWGNCTSLTSLPLLDVSSGTNFSFAWSGCTSLTSFPSNFFNNCLGTNFNNAFGSTALTQTSIDNILVSIESNTTSNGTFNQSGGSAPSATGEAAITDMRSRGWTITVTGGF